MDRQTVTDAGGFSLKKPAEVRNPQIGTTKPEVLQSASYSFSSEIHGRFFERTELSLDSFEYQRNGDDPGLVMVFNQEEFDIDLETREGSSKDVRAITTCLSRLGFNIKEENILENLSREEIFGKVDGVLKSDLSHVNSSLVFILTHGANCNEICSRKETFQLEKLLMKFEHCPALEGKPKLFVVQACKGTEITQLSDEKKIVNLVPSSTFGKFHQDMVIVYSTLEGRYSYRNTDYGSWLIQEICRNFTAYGRRDDVVTMLTRVIKCTCTNYFHFPDSKSEAQKQIPVIISSLSKKFYLNKNKDRHFVLTSSEMQYHILDTLKNIYVEIKDK